MVRTRIVFDERLQDKLIRETFGALGVALDTVQLKHQFEICNFQFSMLLPPMNSIGN